MWNTGLLNTESGLPHLSNRKTEKKALRTK
jgi:hypothetical protein